MFNVYGGDTEMKDNTITTADGVEVYTSQITEIADRYISDLEDKESIYDYTVFTDMLLSISDNMTPLNNYNDITVLDNLFNIYKRLCSKYQEGVRYHHFKYLSA